MAPRLRRRLSLLTVPAATAVLLAMVPSSGMAAQEYPRLDRVYRHVSSSVAVRAMIANPESAPESLRPSLRALRDVGAGAVGSSSTARSVSQFDRFNNDDLGLPQNEESVDVCLSNPNIVLGGTNDYRGLLDPQGSFTGWHFSINGGRSLANEGVLPPVRIGEAAVPSGGDPVDAIGPNCSLFAGSLNYDPDEPFSSPNGVGVYRSSRQRLTACTGGSDPSCWPTRRAVATSRPGHFLDKEWMAVGRSGSAGDVVWATYTDFDFSDPNTPPTARIYAVRCSADLATCTEPILISGNDADTQFSYVTIDGDGRTYVTWSEIQGELEGTPQTFVHKLRVAGPGGTTFGPERIIEAEDQAIPFGGKLNANDFRVATILKNGVAMVNGRPRVFATWDACSVRVLDFVCEDAQVKLRWSDDLGRTWSPTVVVSVNGQNYFPTIDVDPETRRVVLAYFTNRFDLAFDNRQDVEMVTLSTAAPGRVLKRQRLTSPSNETEADPLLGGFFIGDYIQVAAAGGGARVHYNANYVQTPLLGQGRPIPQQDNFLARAGQ